MDKGKTISATWSLTLTNKKLRDAVDLWIKRYCHSSFNPLSAKLTKWPNTLKKFVGNLPTNCLNVFGHFVGLSFKF